jgi:hypothetical protein
VRKITVGRSILKYLDAEVARSNPLHLMETPLTAPRERGFFLTMGNTWSDEAGAKRIVKRK